MKQFKPQKTKETKDKIENFYNFSGSWYNRFISFYEEMLEKQADSELTTEFPDITDTIKATETFLKTINPDFKPYVPDTK